MLLTLVSVITSLLFIWCYTRWREVKNYWKDKGVPHYPPHPIMGSLTFLQRQNPSLWMQQLYKDFKAPYVGIWAFWRPALVINSPEIARQVLVKDADVFRNRFLSSGKSDPIGALNLFTANDPLWTRLRRRFTSMFTAAKLRNHSNITLNKSKDLVERIREEEAKNNHLNIRTLCTDYTTDVIGESAFGIICETTKTGDSVMRTVTREFMDFNLHRGLCWSSIFFFPELVDIFRFKFFPTKSVEKLRYMYRSIIKLRGGYEKEVTDPKDMLDTLIKLKQDMAAANEDISEDCLLSQAAIFLLGGFDTSGTTMAWVLYMLAWHPKYQQIVYEEILAAKKQLGDEDLDSTTLAGLTYLTCVIKETLRIYPPMAWLDRIAARDYRIDDKLTIKAGTTVYVNACGMQMDPEYFPDPSTFNPNRFLPGNEGNIKPYTYMPFGEGPRNCIGMRFGYHTLRRGISSILLNYEIQPLPNSPDPKNIQIDKNAMFYVPADERMVIKFVPRIS